MARRPRFSQRSDNHVERVSERRGPGLFSRCGKAPQGIRCFASERPALERCDLFAQKRNDRIGSAFQNKSSIGRVFWKGSLVVRSTLAAGFPVQGKTAPSKRMGPR